MNYEQIKNDVKEFHDVMRSFNIIGYCALGSLILEYCLHDHGIKAELVMGYAIVGDECATLHIWNKIHLHDGTTKQIDMVHTSKECPFTLHYTTKMQDKWKLAIDGKEGQQKHDNLVEFVKIYRKTGRDDALKYLKKYKSDDATGWEWIFGIISGIKTFQTIGKYKSLFL
jgi:hypothetical protein